jgi:hypothetical protein
MHRGETNGFAYGAIGSLGYNSVSCFNDGINWETREDGLL